MIVREEGRLFKAHGENLMDVLAWLRSSSRRWSTNSSHSEGRAYEWDFNLGYAGAVSLAEKGWSEGGMSMASKLTALPPITTSDPKWRYDVAGERPDIGRFLSGDPCCMMRHGHPKGQRPILCLAIPIVASVATQATQMMNYGTAMLSLVDKLEHAGRRVEVRATHIGEVDRSNGIVAASWTVKHAQDSVDLAALAFSLAHPAASRRISFAMVERAHVGGIGLYGLPIRETEEHLVDPVPGTLVLQRMQGSRCNTLNDALRFASEQINKAAGETLVEVEG